MADIKSYKQLIEEASAKIQTLSIDDAKKKLGNPDVVFVDLREPSELENEGIIPSSLHIPRGVLEFLASPDSPYFQPVFAEDKQFILYCQSGWRSALATATLQDMGFRRVCHIDGGFSAWKNSGGSTVTNGEEL
ncbi:MAG: rhodanese-like domain-containing protein [Gammaproteobacteria bacterium]|nr:MAG: rhodanese-like domain-containing protein [Gammaproteobacteria bacterium]